MNFEESENSLSSMVAECGDCGGDYDGPCLCCDIAYDSFDSIDSVRQTKKEAAAKVAERAAELFVERAAEKVAETCSCGQCGGTAVVQCYESHAWKKHPLGSDEGTLQNVSEWQTLSEDGANCELLKSGSATCPCAECCGAAIYDDNHGEYSDSSIHSEDCLNYLTTTHV
jgi:hypothetical protein